MFASVSIKKFIKGINRMTKINIKEIKGFTGYSVTEDGRIWSNKSNKWLSPSLSYKGYQKVDLFCEGKRKGMYVHRLVAVAFLELPVGDAITVDHIDGDKINNSASNLQWLSVADNIIKEQAKNYQFRNPTGRVVNVYNLNGYCRKYGLDASNMRALFLGRSSTCKGWSRV